MSTLKTNNIQHVDRSDPSIIINTDGSVNIAGTMTYEDVTNVDAVGIITGRSLINAQKQVHVGTGVSVKSGGLNVTAGITTVQALQATTGTFSAAVSGTTGTFSGAVSGTTGTFTGDVDIASSLVHTGDTDTKLTFTTDNISLITGGTTRVNITSGGNLEMPNDNDYIKIGAGGDLQLVHTGGSSNIVNNTGALQIQSNIVRFDNASGTEYGRFDSSGRLNIGAAAAVSQTRNLNVGSNSEANLAIETHNDAASESANIRFYKSRGTAGSPTAVADNHYIGQMIFYGQDGTDYANTVGYMRVGVDGTVASNQIPGEMEFGINDGSSASRAMTINKSGNVLFSGLTAKNDPRNAKGISLKSPGGISFQTYGSNGSRNWRIRPDDLTGWGTLEFSVSPTTNDSSDWPDAAGDVVMSLQGDKDVKVNNGNLILTNTKGINFYNYGSGSGVSSNLLDDYEEGTWTPVMQYYTSGAFQNVTMTTAGTIQQPKYTKVGRWVTATMNWTGFQINGSTLAYARLTGLPFTTTAYGAAVVSYNYCFSGVQNQGGWLANGQISVDFYRNGNSWNNWVSNSGSYLQLSCHYQAS